MAKQSMIQREVKRDRLIAKHAVNRREISIALKTNTNYQEKLLTFKKVEGLPRNSASSRHRNRCWVTGRSRAFYKDFGLSRHVLREMAHEGSIPGLTKSSW
jgi:small subunit ribosomal protein S14